MTNKQKYAREYSLWFNIKNKCYNKNAKIYKSIGAKGIRVCERWLNSFDDFVSDIGTYPSKEHVFVRKDLSKDYSPDNFEWITKSESISRIHKTHGLTMKVPEYYVWRSMIDRCTLKKNKSYHNYGGRGITICDRWLGENGFINFYQDMGLRPTPKHQIDRINNDGNYEPSNCRWATGKEECRNKSNNHLLTYEGQTKTMIEWCEILNIDYQTLNSRINRYGWSVEKSLTTPVRKRNNVS